MKSFEQLAQTAYEAYQKAGNSEAERCGAPPMLATWDELEDWEQSFWHAAAKQLWAEFAALH